MIIDASVGVKWLIPEDDSRKAIDLLQKQLLVVPTLFHVEIGNALWKKLRRNEIALEPVLPFYSGLSDLVQTVSELAVAPRAVEIAAELEHAIYDCIYLALAEDMEDELVTCDLRFLDVMRGSPHALRVRPL